MTDRDPGQEARNRELLNSFVRSRVSRRSVLRSSASLAAAGAAGQWRAPRRRAIAAPALSAASVAAARRAMQEGGDSAAAAVAAANALDPKPEVLNVVWEDGLQLEDPTNFFGPRWEELTGIRVNPVGKPFTELFSSQVAEKLGGTGAYDVLTLVPAWTADFVAQGLMEPLGPYIDQYSPDLDDYHPLYRELMNYNGEIYGLFDDGDTIILYYRTDLFEDGANKEAFQAQ
ncbi:MAG TPA: extracellular solute-binding protein, partial [Thermomicrobiales bacterium]|nr:extracellular solute-binding protein [Thermomicrobiales bacterium]